MFSRPTLKQLQKRIESDFSGRLLDGKSLLSRSVLKVLSTVYAGACHLMYGFFEWGHKQVFPDSAEKIYLERWAHIWGIVRKNGAKAKGFCTVTGNATAIVPAQTLLRSTEGVIFITIKDSSFHNGQIELIEFEVEAKEQGALGNIESGAILQFISPILGVENKALSKGITGGVDIEEDALMRARLLLALREPPMGGNKSDYEKWALEVAGVTRAWCLPLYYGVGTVGLTFVCDEQGIGADSSIGTSIIPDIEMVLRVQNHIDAVRPLCAALQVFAPSQKSIDINVRIFPYNEGLAERIKLELKDLFIRVGEVGKVIPLSHIREAISITTGEYDHVLLLPTENIVPEKHEIPILGEIVIQGTE